MNPPRVCRRCYGHKVIAPSYHDYILMHDDEWKQCPRCEGSGVDPLSPWYEPARLEPEKAAL